MLVLANEDKLMREIFISYRRDDTGGFARAIFQYLARQYGQKCVFMDLETLQPGHDFSIEIEQSMAQAKVMIVLIGRDWLGNKSDGTSRIQDSADFVRREVALGLQRNITVMPVLLGNATIPTEMDLPEEIRSLLRHHSAHVTLTRFNADMESIAVALNEAMGIASGWGRARHTVNAIAGYLRTPTAMYCFIATAYAIFATIALAPHQIYDRFGVIHFVTNAFQSAFGHPWSGLDLVVQTPMIALLLLLCAPVINRYSLFGLARGLQVAFWIQLPWLIVVGVFSLVSFDLPNSSAPDPFIRIMQRIFFVGACFEIAFFVARRRFLQRAPAGDALRSPN
jgi:hypothetical protein